MSNGCDCSGNYFNSLSNTMSALPQSDYGLMGGSSLGMNSQEFITGANTRQNSNPYGDNNTNPYADNSNSYNNNSNQYGNNGNNSNQYGNNGNNYINDSNPLNNSNNMNPSMGTPRPQQQQAQPMMRNNQPVVEVKPQPVVQTVVQQEPVKNIVEQPKCNNLLSKNNFLLIVLLLAGLAWHEVIRFYINKSIKCGEGTHQYYVYYAITASAIGFFILSR